MDKCPCCGAKNEIFEDILWCKHDDLNVVWKVAYIKIQKICDKAKLLLNFTRVFLQVVWSIFDAKEMPAALNIPEAMSDDITVQGHI